MVRQRSPTAVEGEQREAGGWLPLLQLDDPGLLERVEDLRGRTVVAAVLARPAHRQGPDDAAQDDDGAAGPAQRLSPARPEDRVRGPAFPAAPGPPRLVAPAARR